MKASRDGSLGISFCLIVGENGSVYEMKMVEH